MRTNLSALARYSQDIKDGKAVGINDSEILLKFAKNVRRGNIFSFAQFKEIEQDLNSVLGKKKFAEMILEYQNHDFQNYFWKLASFDVQVYLNKFDDFKISRQYFAAEIMAHNKKEEISLVFEKFPSFECWEKATTSVYFEVAPLIGQELPLSLDLKNIGLIKFI